MRIMLDDGEEPLCTKDLDNGGRGVDAQVGFTEEVGPCRFRSDGRSEGTVAAVWIPDFGFGFVGGEVFAKGEGCVEVPGEAFWVLE
jgi:hypothetical protein